MAEPDHSAGRQVEPAANEGPAPYGELPDRARKGRGAVSNRAGRYERLAGVAVDDAWRRPDEDCEPPRLDTTVTFDTSRSVIARNDSPDIGFDRSINPYRGCEHGCVYCFARPTHAWLGLSPGLDFETKLFAKPNAAELLRKELAKPNYVCRPIAMGTNTDPYQPVERRMKVTRSILEVLAEHEHPVTIVTKSALVGRDIDILAPMAAKGLAAVGVSVTTLDPALARAMEPRAASPERRLETIRLLAGSGIPVTAMVAPVIPALTDHELEAILIRARDAGAIRAGYILLRLPLELRELFQEWLDAHRPDRKKRVLNRLREMRGGNLYESGFGTRMHGRGHEAKLLEERFRLACRQHGFDGEWPGLDTARFRPPAVPGEASAQLSLFSHDRV